MKDTIHTGSDPGSMPESNNNQKSFGSFVAKDIIHTGRRTISVGSATFAPPPKRNMAPTARCAMICDRLMLGEGKIIELVCSKRWGFQNMVAAHKVGIGYKQVV